MALFGKKNEEVKIETELENYRKYLEKSKKPEIVSKLSEVLKFLDGVIKMEIDNPFNEENMLIETIEKYFITQYEKNTEIEQYVQMIKNVYDQLHITRKNLASFDFSLFLKIFDSNGIYEKDLFDINFYRLFSNQKEYHSVMDSLINNNFALENFNEIIDFFSYIRRYFSTSEEYYVEVLYISRNFVYGFNLTDYIKKYKEKLDKKDGIYNIDEITLDKIHEKTVGAQGFLTSLDEQIKKASKMLEILTGRIEEYSRILDDINRAKITKYNSEIQDKIDEINKKLSESKTELDEFTLNLQDKTRVEITGTFSKILTELEEEKTKIIETLKEYETILSNLALQKSGDIAKLGGEQLTALEEFIKNQPQLEQIFDSVSSKKMFKMMKEFMELQKEMGDISPSQIRSQALEQKIVTSNIPATSVLSAPGLIIPAREVDNRVSKVLNLNIPFKERLKIIEEKIAKNKSNGVLYHDKAIEIISYLMEGYSPYLYGPSGSGKTMLARQLIELLGIDCIKMNYINEEYEIKGAEPFLGQWSPSLTYNAYKYGAGLLVDEMDNGRAQATMALGSFISASDTEYTFANGETVLRHPNFRLIATGNTKCEGPTESHPTREKMDEAIIQRYKPLVYIDYDAILESTMLSRNEEWYEFIKRFRIVGKELNPDENEITIKGAITTRDVIEIANTLKSGFATPEMIIKADFIRAHNIEYLCSLDRKLSEYYKNKDDSPENEIYKVFNKEVKKLQRVKR